MKFPEKYSANEPSSFCGAFPAQGTPDLPKECGPFTVTQRRLAVSVYTKPKSVFLQECTVSLNSNPSEVT